MPPRGRAAVFSGSDGPGVRAGLRGRDRRCRSTPDREPAAHSGDVCLRSRDLKLLLLLLSGLAAAIVIFPLMIGAVVATNPWLAVGALSGPIRVRSSAVRAGVPDDQWPL